MENLVYDLKNALDLNLKLEKKLLKKNNEKKLDDKFNRKQRRHRNPDLSLRKKVPSNSGKLMSSSIAKHFQNKSHKTINDKHKHIIKMLSCFTNNSASLIGNSISGSDRNQEYFIR
jgi:hypothetical protein